MSWSIRSVPLDELEVDQAEPTAELARAFAQHQYRLVDIASDPFILGQPPYCEHQPGEQVGLPIALAIPHPVRLRIFDGIHRAIQLARNGQSEIDVGAPETA